MRIKQQLKVAAAASALALSLAACGDAGDDGVARASTSTSPRTPPTSSTTAPA